MILFILMIVIGLIFHFEPAIDTLKDGSTVLWYNSDRRIKERKYIKLW